MFTYRIISFLIIGIVSETDETENTSTQPLFRVKMTSHQSVGK